MNNIEIRKELEAVVRTIAVRLNTPARPVLVNWEAERGDHKDKNAIYLEPALLPAPTQYTGFQQTARIYTGIFQISVVFPALSGTLLGETYAQAIVDAPEWKTVRPGGILLQLTDAPYYGAVLEGEGVNGIPISVMYLLCA